MVLHMCRDEKASPPSGPMSKKGETEDNEEMEEGGRGGREEEGRRRGQGRGGREKTAFEKLSKGVFVHRQPGGLTD